MIVVVNEDNVMLTKRLPKSIVIRILSGSVIESAIALSKYLLEAENRCRSAFFNENKAVSVPEKKAEKSIKSNIINM